MDKTRLVIIEESDWVIFIDRVEAFINSHKVHFESLKFQRNLFYRGIGGSAGKTPGVTAPCPPEPDRDYVAFIVYDLENP